MNMPEHNYLEISTERRILIITMSNPPNNYLPEAMFGELGACRDLMLSPDFGAVIFTGKGNVFSKGADIGEAGKNPLGWITMPFSMAMR